MSQNGQWWCAWLGGIDATLVLGLVGLVLVSAGCGQSSEREGEENVMVDTEEAVAPVILFLGDSLTAGYQLDPEDAFPALIQRRIDEKGWPYRVMNAGVSGDTTTDGLNRLDWLLSQPVKVLVLALGSNDALRGQPVDMIENNLREIVQRTRARYPEVRIVLAGMRMPVNLGEPYRSDFAAIYVRLAEELSLTLIPFLLDGVGGVAALNLEDGIHPTEAGHEVMAQTVWRYVEPVLTSSPR